jgi:hypothetical protein
MKKQTLKYAQNTSVLILFFFPIKKKGRYNREMTVHKETKSTKYFRIELVECRLIFPELDVTPPPSPVYDDQLH